ncbi:MAG: transposase [Saprospiraceae bacterium]
MQYLSNEIYHIYNQSNDGSVIFISHENYLYFLLKIREKICPYVDFLAYSIMPNHFHWLVYTKPAACEYSNAVKPMRKYRNNLISEKELLNESEHRQQKLSTAIGGLLSGYTRAFNKMYDKRGARFRKPTKAKNGMIEELITLDGKYSHLFFHMVNPYPRICFNYIHDNAPKANLVSKSEDYLYSSARDYAGLRNGTLCNQKLAKELNLI